MITEGESLRHFSAVLLAAVGLVGVTGPAPAAERMSRYALILSDPPVAERMSIRTAGAASYRNRIRTAQASLERELAQRNFRVTGAVQTVLNAVFVVAYPSQVKDLLALPGVKGIAPLHRYKLKLNKAVGLEDIPAAWTALGGQSNAGAGVKIAIIDTGVDVNHPAFQDPTMQLPSGFTPICTQGLNESQTCTGFTNNKVIIARSYVAELAAGSFTGGASRPDDISPRDHIGHGTANAMISAGGTNTSPTGITITGMAPKAWIGNYKVFGSGGVNDFTGGDVLISAIDDALTDGMNVANLSLGSPATSGPLDTGTVCGLPAGPSNYCDPEAHAVSNAIGQGMLVVAAAGNDGETGVDAQNGGNLTVGTIDSPGTVATAIAAGSSTNSHTFVDGLIVPGLSTLQASFGDGPLPLVPLTAPLSDVTQVDSTGFACDTLPANSLTGTIVLINRGGQCTFQIKVGEAQSAGAAGVVFVDNIAEPVSSIMPGGLILTSIPAALISSSDGATLRSFFKSHAGLQVSLGLSVAEVDLPAGQYNTVSAFSSRGPSITGLLKPEAMGVGDPVYMATQTYDSNGEMWDPSGYIAASGTSFATPMYTGSAALVLQKNPGFTPAQVKSALVGSANQVITDPNDSTAGTGTVTAMGNGLLDGGKAIAATVSTDPATLSFGGVPGPKFPQTQTLTVSCSAAASLSLSIAGATAPSVSPTSLSCTPGTPSTVTLTSPSFPSVGFHQGTLTISGSNTQTVRVPYLITVGDGQPFDILPIAGDGFDDPVNSLVATGLAFRVVDQYGVSVPNAPVFWGVQAGSEGTIQNDATRTTDGNGVASADALLGPDSGPQGFQASVGNLLVTFTGTARNQPTINPSGAVNAASYQALPGIVPGSYISLFGTALSSVIQNAIAVPLPVGLSDNGNATAGVSVSFEVPAAGLSLPGRMLYADPSQVNVQVPWELAGQTTVQIRVNVGDSTGAIYNAPVVQYAPGIYFDAATSTAAALDTSMNRITAANPAKTGAAIQLFVNGLGAVSNPPADGEVALSNPLSKTSAQATVTVGGQAATVSFSGLAPGFPGLYQVNFTVPSGLSAGSQPVIVSIGSVSSPAVNLPVQ
jgi:minor extracellular serine protease Vpr